MNTNNLKKAQSLKAVLLSRAVMYEGESDGSSSGVEDFELSATELQQLLGEPPMPETVPDLGRDADADAEAEANARLILELTLAGAAATLGQCAFPGGESGDVQPEFQAAVAKLATDDAEEAKEQKQLFQQIYSCVAARDTIAPETKETNRLKYPKSVMPVYFWGAHLTGVSFGAKSTPDGLNFVVEYCRATGAIANFEQYQKGDCWLAALANMFVFVRSRKTFLYEMWRKTKTNDETAPDPETRSEEQGSKRWFENDAEGKIAQQNMLDVLLQRVGEIDEIYQTNGRKLATTEDGKEFYETNDCVIRTEKHDEAITYAIQRINEPSQRNTSIHHRLNLQLMHLVSKSLKFNEALKLLGGMTDETDETTVFQVMQKIAKGGTERDLQAFVMQVIREFTQVTHDGGCWKSALYVMLTCPMVLDEVQDHYPYKKEAETARSSTRQNELLNKQIENCVTSLAEALLHPDSANLNRVNELATEYDNKRKEGDEKAITEQLERNITDVKNKGEFPLYCQGDAVGDPFCHFIHSTQFSMYSTMGDEKVGTRTQSTFGEDIYTVPTGLLADEETKTLENNCLILATLLTLEDVGCSWFALHVTEEIHWESQTFVRGHTSFDEVKHRIDMRSNVDKAKLLKGFAESAGVPKAQNHAVLLIGAEIHKKDSSATVGFGPTFRSWLDSEPAEPAAVASTAAVGATNTEKEVKVTYTTHPIDVSQRPSAWFASLLWYCGTPQHEATFEKELSTLVLRLQNTWGNGKDGNEGPIYNYRATDDVTGRARWACALTESSVTRATAFIETKATADTNAYTATLGKLYSRDL
jgi:hypothetical protein